MADTDIVVINGVRLRREDAVRLGLIPAKPVKVLKPHRGRKVKEA